MILAAPRCDHRNPIAAGGICDQTTVIARPAAMRSTVRRVAHRCGLPHAAMRGLPRNVLRRADPQTPPASCGLRGLPATRGIGGAAVASDMPRSCGSKTPPASCGLRGLPATGGSATRSSIVVRSPQTPPASCGLRGLPAVGSPAKRSFLREDRRKQPPLRVDFVDFRRVAAAGPVTPWRRQSGTSMLAENLGRP